MGAWWATRYHSRLSSTTWFEAFTQQIMRICQKRVGIMARSPHIYAIRCSLNAPNSDRSFILISHAPVLQPTSPDRKSLLAKSSQKPSGRIPRFLSPLEFPIFEIRIVPPILVVSRHHFSVHSSDCVTADCFVRTRKN